MFVCLIEARIRTSLRAFSFSLSESLPILTFLSAYAKPSLKRITEYTLLYAPSPSTLEQIVTLDLLESSGDSSFSGLDLKNL